MKKSKETRRWISFMFRIGYIMVLLLSELLLLWGIPLHSSENQCEGNTTKSVRTEITIEWWTKTSTGLNDSPFYLSKFTVCFLDGVWRNCFKFTCQQKGLIKSSRNCIPCCLNFLSFRVMGDDNCKMTV